MVKLDITIQNLTQLAVCYKDYFHSLPSSDSPAYARVSSSRCAEEANEPFATPPWPEPELPLSGTTGDKTAQAVLLHHAHQDIVPESLILSGRQQPTLHIIDRLAISHGSHAVPHAEVE